MFVKKVLVHEATQKAGRGVPATVRQIEVKSRTKKMKVRGTVKVKVMKNKNICPNIIAASV